MPAIDYPNLQVGTVLVKEFFIVALVPPQGIGFFVCGSPDIPIIGGEPGKFTPCVGTSRKQAEDWFKRAKQKGFANCDGKLVLIELNAGRVIQMHQCTHQGAQDFPA